MSEAVELEPCPFCGGKAEIERAGTPRFSTIYACTDCGCRLETGETWGHGAAWNRRSLTGEGEPVATDAEFFDAVVGWLSARDMIDRQDALDGLTVAEVIAALDEHENGMATARPRPVACPDREAVARVLFQRGRTVHDAESWEACGDEMREWLLGHADAIFALSASGGGE